MYFNIQKQTNNATAFAEFIEKAVAERHLQPGDVLVLDNAVIHTGGENEFL